MNAINKIKSKYQIVCLIFMIIFSCNEKNRVEKKIYGDYTVENIFKNNSLVSVKTFKKDTLILVITYDKNIITQASEYYLNHKIKTVSKLIKMPNHYYDTSYFENGTMKSEGESDCIDGFRLRRGGTIFYNRSGKVYSIMFFTNDGKNEYLTHYSIFDTINEKKILKSIKYDSPVILNKKKFLQIKKTNIKIPID